ncbi:MAG: DUF718 domain-containing protein [Rhizobiales bacterium]|nr:DUF718 domain-containing protein [Hyphomicrobiales bacterium]
MAFNKDCACSGVILRFRVKSGHEQRFIAAHRDARTGFKGFRGGALVRTGEHTFCVIGEWANFARLVNARPQMIGLLDGLREHLEDLGGGLGVTDPVSGETVVKLKASTAAKKNPRGKVKAGKRKKRG